ncbi:glycosyltransferase [Marivirga harenae]|uniref:glycosyltransferase n=1 Tax=Marivirga harenae TaxID=2010992 RepID=UPI0026DFF7CC|nr:glycosyltransferase [Marivirga harenae]WKV12887.1 glycosyltransferase [Marivirga harenae]
MDFSQIIYIALARWDGQYASTAFSIAEELSNQQKKIYYIENPLTLKDILLKIHKKETSKRLGALFLGINSTYKIKNNLIAVTPYAVLPINWMPKGKLYGIFTKFNNSLFRKSVERVIRKEKLDDYIIYNSFNPFYTFSSKSRPAKLSIYQSVDDISQSEYIKKHGVNLEKKYAQSSDVVLVTSSHLKKKLSKYNQNTHLVANAANVKLFNKAFDQEENELNLGTSLDKYKVVIGYVGNICHRLNYKLLLKIVNEYPEYLLLMVGPINDNNPEIQNLKKHTNVFFTGPKKPAELVPYLRKMNCSIIPFLKNELTKSIYPLKINEYLAAGLPVITTNFSEDIKSFKDVIYLSNNEHDFTIQIQKAIEENNLATAHKRMEFVASNNWTNRTLQILDIIKNQSDNE